MGVEARELREAWFRRALDSAGIERRSWRPTVEAVYGDYAAQWGFPADAVTNWRTSAAQRGPGDGYYDTHVFTPPEIGPVHLEFQVSHHVPERAFVVAALFSWPAQAPSWLI